MAKERPEVVMSALEVGTADASDALEIVTTGAKPLAELLDTLQAVSTVGGRVLLLVVLTEVGEMVFKHGMKFVAITGIVPVRRHGRDRDCRAHIDIYWESAPCFRWRESDAGDTNIKRTDNRFGRTGKNTPACVWAYTPVPNGNSGKTIE